MTMSGFVQTDASGSVIASHRLLVVDDEAAICRFVRRVAEQLGFTVETVSSARDSIDAARRLEPSVIVLDLAMPEMDGIEVMRQLAAAGCKARIVLTTGFDAYYLEAARKIGELSGFHAITTLPKPLRSTTLRAAVLGAAA
jgi:CheY-like chemotaxis protein